MKYKLAQRSIASRYTLFIVIIILFQSLLLISMLIAGGVLAQSTENAYKTFDATVTYRAKSIQNEIDNRWTNIDPYMQEITRKLSETDISSSEEECERFLLDISDTIISMLRVSGTTGSFIILDDRALSGRRSAVYIRDYDPQTNNPDNGDLYLVMGPSAISKELQIPLDMMWHYGFLMNQENENFFKKPYEASSKSRSYKELGYWSKPFRITSQDEPIITYSVPLFDNKGQVHGVAGVEVSAAYMKTLLPAGELASQDSLGYILAARKDDSEGLTPMIMKGGYQERIFNNVDEMVFAPRNPNHSVYQLMNGNSGNKIYACIKSLDLYNKNVPYDSETWVVAGLMDSSKLFEFVNHLKSMLILSLLASLVIGAAAGAVISRKITEPIVKLARKVRNFDYTKKIELECTGLSELDQLSKAIEVSNSNLLESTLRMSEIMDLLKVPMGAFEYKLNESRAMLTNQVFELLGIEREEKDSMYVDKDLFLKRIEEVWQHPEPEEPDVYQIQEEPPRWAKIYISDRGENYLGVIRDVTEEILEKNLIKYERDYDFLTKLYNGAAFEREVTSLLETGQLKVSALLMLDLDGLKLVNDRYGHGFGDVYIIEAASRFSAFTPANIVAGRRSGDEFYVFFYGYEDAEEIRKEIAALYEDLERHEISLPNGQPFKIRVSSGISWYGKDSFSYEELVQHADYAMYKIKHTVKGKLGEFS